MQHFYLKILIKIKCLVKGGVSAMNDLQVILKQMQVSDKENKGTSGGRGKNSYNNIFHIWTERKDFLSSKHSVLELRLAFKSQQ